MDDSEPQKMLRASQEIHSLKRYSESGFALPLTLIRSESQNVNKQTCKSFPRTLQIEEGGGGSLDPRTFTEVSTCEFLFTTYYYDYYWGCVYLEARDLLAQY